MYHDFLQGNEDLNHMNRVRVVKHDMNRFYISHYAILKETSTTTKLRTVFNGSIKLEYGISLKNLLSTADALRSNYSKLF